MEKELEIEGMRAKIRQGRWVVGATNATNRNGSDRPLLSTTPLLLLPSLPWHTACMLQH